jgi:DNA processing protein
MRSASVPVGLGYVPPRSINHIALHELLENVGRPALADKQLNFLQPDKTVSRNIAIHYAGDLALLKRPAVSIVGTREVSADGRARTHKLARELAAAGLLVVSGLARGVDTAAHTSAIEAGGVTAAVIGTPLSKAYPAENAPLQEVIYREHLLLSPFSPDEQVYKGNFPKRNRIMAAITDATVIIEASDSSGTLHQAAECQLLGRWLFILRSVVENPTVTWPQRFLSGPKTAVIDSTAEVISKIASS